MKQAWTQPRAEAAVFRADEYVAACYKIKCTTPHGNGWYYHLYEDTNGDGRLDEGDRELHSSWTGFSGCNKWHKGVIQANPPYANGFVTQLPKEILLLGNDSVEAPRVYWWHESLGSTSDYHVMTPGSENYETNPNAS